jgi:fermentation-respiration switch protein FrsA (DUF1100 family)
VEAAGFAAMLIRAVRRILALIAILVVLYLLGCGYMWATQRQQIFEPEPQLQSAPNRNGMRFEDVYIASGEGAERGKLHGWWIPAEQTDAPTLLYLHGNYRNIGYNVEHAMRLHGLGYNLLLVDYRGYGNSTGGEPSEAKMYEDAEAAWKYLMTQRASGAPRTFIYGHSLGGAIAIDLAVRHPEAAGIIAESSFTSMPAMAMLDYGYLPVDWILNQRFDSLLKISALKIPILLIHGTWDKKVPPQMSQQLFDRAPQPKTLQLIAGGEHSNNSGIAWAEYRSALDQFVQRYGH